jgi:hypothetical protein
VHTREQSGHDEQRILEYLLGALPPGETERLDELSVTDDEFAERLQAVEYDLIDAYVRGELTGEMLGRFQSSYLASPKRRERVHLAQSLHKAAKQTALPIHRGWRRFLTPPPRPALQWGLAAAAAVLVTVAGWLAVENRRLQDQTDAVLAERRSAEQRIQQLEAQLTENRTAPKQAPESPVILAFNLAPQTRGASPLPAIILTAGVDYVTLQLELESAEYFTWRATLRPAPRQEPVWRSGRLSAYARDDVRIVTLSFPPRLLETRVYIVELSGISASGSEELIASYPFRVIRK